MKLARSEVLCYAAIAVVAMQRDVETFKNINELSFGLEDTTYTAVQRQLRSYIFCRSQSYAVKAWVCGFSLAGIMGSNPAGAWMSVCYECCVLSGRGLCVGLIP